jgi:hypothetical protein
MGEFKKAFYYLFNQPNILTEELFIRYAKNKIYSDEEYLKKLFFWRKWQRLDLDNPKTFSEKCQWLKLYDHKPIYHQMVDKYEAKQLVASLIGEEYVIPTYGVWESVEDIDWESLPEKFVIKPTHSGGADCILICKDKSKFDIENAKHRLQKTMYPNGIWNNLREWTYKDIKPRIIAEQYLEDKLMSYPQDYKFWCFDGKVKCFYITTGRSERGHVRDNFFDVCGRFISDIEHVGYKSDSHCLPPIPSTLPQMIELAQTLSKGVPHLRVDLYDVGGKIYFGELTFAEESGFAEFRPKRWNYTFGEWIKLPEKLV